jgi:hypothetical protein
MWKYKLCNTTSNCLAQLELSGSTWSFVLHNIKSYWFFSFKHSWISMPVEDVLMKEIFMSYSINHISREKYLYHQYITSHVFLSNGVLCASAWAKNPVHPESHRRKPNCNSWTFWHDWCRMTGLYFWTFVFLPTNYI